MAMKPELKTRWVNKLREPGRVQGKGQLRDLDGRQCCLDLACEIAVEDGVIPAPKLLNEDSVLYSYEDGTNVLDGKPTFQDSVLPGKVAEYLGIDDSNPEVEIMNPDYDPDNDYGDDDVPATQSETLSELNDVWDIPFPEIADLIENSNL